MTDHQPPAEEEGMPWQGNLVRAMLAAHDRGATPGEIQGLLADHMPPPDDPQHMAYMALFARVHQEATQAAQSSPPEPTEEATPE